MEQQANPPHPPPPPPKKGEGAQKPKRAITHPTPTKSRRKVRKSQYVLLTTPPPPQIKDEAAQKPTRTIFPSLIWGGGRGQV